jgi:hypothetical protein
MHGQETMLRLSGLTTTTDKQQQNSVAHTRASIAVLLEMGINHKPKMFTCR